MTGINSETKTLLDKLYNLRGEKSVILVNMDEEREKAIVTRDKTSEQKKELEGVINELSSDEYLLIEEGTKLQNALEVVGKAEFIDVLKHLKIDFDPGQLSQKVALELPKKLEQIAQNRSEKQEQLIKVEDEMNDAIMRIEELGIRKDEALSDQTRLNRFFEMALNENINVTRDEITSLLAKLNFNEDEQRKAAKILMFPEDGLLEYEKYSGNVKVINKKEEMVSEITNENFEEPVIEEEPIEEEISVQEEPAIEFDHITEPEVSIGPAITFEPIVEPEITIDSPIVEETSVMDDFSEEEEIATSNSKEDVVNLMSGLGFDYLDFTSNDFNKMVDNFNAEMFTKNVNLIERYNINKDVFVDNIELLYDTELESKINLLTQIGKDPRDIYLNPRVLTKYNFTELSSAIKTLSDSGLEPKSVPLMAY